MTNKESTYIFNGRKCHIYDKEEWMRSLKPGDYAWDCGYKRRKIVSITGPKDYPFLNFKDGRGCSANNCADKFKWT